MRKLLGAFWHAIKDFADDECLTRGAGIAYYTLFSLPPMLVLVFFVAEMLGVPTERVEDVVRDQLGMPTLEEPDVGDDEEGGLLAIAGRAQERRTEALDLGIGSRIIGIGLILFSAAGLFFQLQNSLNKIWEVEPDPKQGGIRNFITKRLLSLGMVAVVAFLLLVSLVITTLIEELVKFLLRGFPVVAGQVVGYLLNSLLTLFVATVLFAVTFKILPDAKIRWKDMWLGAFLTALLFVIGKTLMGFWLQRSEVGGEWGSAGASIVAMLMWSYYTALIVLFGAEVTKAWAELYGGGVTAEAGAVRAVEVTKHQPSSPPASS